MNRFDKALLRLGSLPSDYTYSEVVYLLNHLGFEEMSKGSTSGSRVKFYRKYDQRIIMFHKPHPGNVMSIGSVRYLYKCLKEFGEL